MMLRSRPPALVLAATLAGCSAAGGDSAPAPPNGVDGDGSGAGSGGPSSVTCTVGFEVAPLNPVAGPTAVVHVTALLSGEPGVPAFDWHVTFDGSDVPFTTFGAGTEIAIDVAIAGVYDISLDVTSGLNLRPCVGSTAINVAAANARTDVVRLRVVPPSSMPAPLLEKTQLITGGATADLGTLVVDGGLQTQLRVLGPAGGLPAYLRLTQGDASAAVIEAFTDSAGDGGARLMTGSYQVLVIPSVGGVAPRRITGWPAQLAPPIVLDAGARVTGTVHGPGDTALADATVQLTIDGVPSTVATTGATGQFELLAPAATGAVTVEVTPPAGSGLPRLTATSTSLNLALAVDVSYANNLVRKDLAGVQIERQHAAAGNARVTIVGSMAAGMVTAGGSATATGIIRVTATADGNGVLPSTLVPAADDLSAVIEVGPGDFAVAALTTRAALPATLDAPPMQVIATAAVGVDASGSTIGLPGAVLDAVPLDALALAAAPALHVTAEASGAIVAALASGGRYDLRFRDPAGRRASLVVGNRVVPSPGVTPPAGSQIELSYRLPPALELRGTVKLNGSLGMPNASVQVLCGACTGLDRDKPIAEAITGNTGQFVLSVPDPGTL